MTAQEKEIVNHLENNHWHLQEIRRKRGTMMLLIFCRWFDSDLEELDLEVNYRNEHCRFKRVMLEDSGNHRRLIEKGGLSSWKSFN